MHVIFFTVTESTVLTIKGATRATLTHPFVCDKKGRPLGADVGKCKNLYKTALRFVSAHV
ncbi:hypothetical protein WN944_018000 [Citrus x changshan-huyou]|uniref:Uncharacterized protein n=1 Tax=Citrus x changshan-huyou TaxID=2935761 RepID=A0AAP0LVF0_9ROSI